MGELINRWQIKPSSGLIPSSGKPLSGELLPASRSISVEHRPTTVQVRHETKVMKIGGQQFKLDALSLMRMIRQITQTIGEYKRMEHAYGQYVIPALRKARSDIVSDLERHFGLHWEISKTTGESVFYKN